MCGCGAVDVCGNCRCSGCCRCVRVSGAGGVEVCARKGYSVCGVGRRGDKRDSVPVSLQHATQDVPFPRRTAQALKGEAGVSQGLLYGAFAAVCCENGTGSAA